MTYDALPDREKKLIGRAIEAKMDEYRSDAENPTPLIEFWSDEARRKFYDEGWVTFGVNGWTVSDWGYDVYLVELEQARKTKPAPAGRPRWRWFRRNRSE